MSYDDMPSRLADDRGQRFRNTGIIQFHLLFYIYPTGSVCLVYTSLLRTTILYTRKMMGNIVGIEGS